MVDNFTNLDALWLSQLADSLPREQAATQSRLRLIAQHLQSMDERIAVLQNNRTYEQGWADAQRQILGRSNIVNPPEEDARGQEILALIDKRVAEGRVKRVPLGERALDDQPHVFNAPLRRKPTKATPAISLDLSGLDEL